jgi:hypothetical protein
MPTNKVKSAPENPQATVVTTRQEIKVVRDPKEVTLAVNGHLDYNGKRLLVVRGSPDSCATISQVYARFAHEKDDTGAAFRVSVRLHGLTHIDPTWKTVQRISGKAFLDYVGRWFCGAQMVTNSDGPALIILDEIPPLFGAQAQQGRY